MAKETNKRINEFEKSEIQRIQEQQEQLSLFRNADALLPDRSSIIKREQFELENGFVGTVDDLMAMLHKKPRNIDPMFPYKIPFFKLIFKLNGWHNRSYTEFIKPPIVGRIIRQFIYKRFPENILPTLLELPNPILFGYVKKYKLYQYLTDDGLRMLEKFISDAIEVMKVSSDWRAFETTYCELYDLEVPPIQGNLFDLKER